jgi:hypothetical protein
MNWFQVKFDDDLWARKSRRIFVLNCTAPFNQSKVSSACSMQLATKQKEILDRRWNYRRTERKEKKEKERKRLTDRKYL